MFFLRQHTLYVSQLIRYARACSEYQGFIEQGRLLTKRLLTQGYRRIKLVSTFNPSPADPGYTLPLQTV